MLHFLLLLPLVSAATYCYDGYIAPNVFYEATSFTSPTLKYTGSNQGLCTTITISCKDAITAFHIPTMNASNCAPSANIGIYVAHTDVSTCMKDTLDFNNWAQSQNISIHVNICGTTECNTPKRQSFEENAFLIFSILGFVLPFLLVHIVWKYRVVKFNIHINARDSNEFKL